MRTTLLPLVAVLSITAGLVACSGDDDATANKPAAAESTASTTAYAEKTELTQAKEMGGKAIEKLENVLASAQEEFDGCEGKPAMELSKCGAEVLKELGSEWMESAAQAAQESPEAYQDLAEKYQELSEEFTNKIAAAFQ